MDFQRLFKRKEEGPLPPLARDSTREILNARSVLVREGELLDGKTPASLVWSNVGGTISVKADKVLGILEGRTRIKAAVLQELYPGLFEKPPNPGTEFTIPLQAVVTQLEDVFARGSSEEADLEDFDTPFGQLAREDEARFKDGHADRPEVRAPAASNSLLFPNPGLKAALYQRDQIADPESPPGKKSSPEQEEKNPPGLGRPGSVDRGSQQGKIPFRESSAIPTSLDQDRGEIGKPFEAGRTWRDHDSLVVREEQSEPPIEELFPALEARHAASGDSPLSSGARKIRHDHVRREAQACLQELYLTDEPLDASKIASLILQLPGVVGVVIMLSDGAALGGGLSGGLSEGLLSVTPDFAKHLLGFSKSIQGGPANFATFASQAFQISLTLAGDVLILVAHEGKRLPPGLRERLVATAQAVNMIYGPQL